MMRYGSEFQQVNPATLTQYDMYRITGRTELPLGAELWKSRGYGDYDDCYEVIHRPMFIQEQMDEDIVRDGQEAFWWERADEYYAQLDD